MAQFLTIERWCLGGFLNDAELILDLRSGWSPASINRSRLFKSHVDATQTNVKRSRGVWPPAGARDVFVCRRPAIQAGTTVKVGCMGELGAVNAPS